ncbi:MAG: acetyl-CoA carboxylase biotin carboxyl carrier protein subunit [Vampirovibrionales bacterium]|nr:acetyl-CoA carboxylase biotin carboxyl carrier protein subunit [Vampirovibrionales bacterium]
MTDMISELLITQQQADAISGIIRREGSQKAFNAVCLPSDSLELNRYQIWLDGETYILTRENPKARRSAGSAKAGGLADIKAPMPGTVLKVLVEEGQVLEPNQPVVVMESMKMEMTLSASAAATVDAVQCAAGQLVDMNAVLVKLKPV